MNSSSHDDLIEIESFTDSGSNLNRENQSEAEDAKDSLNVTCETSENAANESEQETSKWHEKAKKVAEGGVTTSSKPTEYTVKKQHKQKFQHQKIPLEACSETKKLKKTLTVTPRHQKWLQDLAAD